VRTLAILIAGCTLVGCSSATELDVTLQTNVTLAALSLTATAAPGGKQVMRQYGDGGTPLPTTLQLLLPDATTSVTVTANGSASDGRPVHAQTQFAVTPRRRTSVTLPLDAATLTLLAGALGGPGFSDGSGAGARLTLPVGLAFDGSGTLYIADAGTSTIRKLTLSSGAISTIAGKPFAYGSVDGTSSDARFAAPNDVVLDGQGNLYVSDHDACVIRMLTLSSGAVTTLVGTPFACGASDGTGAAAQLQNPGGMAVAGATLYLADEMNHAIRKVGLPGGQVTTLAGLPGTPGFADGTGTTARFNTPRSLALAGATLYVADDGNDVIRAIAVASGAVSTVAGMAGMAGSSDGSGASARFSGPRGLALDAAGDLAVVDTFNEEIRLLTPSSRLVATLAGGLGVVGSDDGTGPAAHFSQPLRAAADATGGLYISDWQNSTVRRLDLATHAVTTVAGVAPSIGAGDGTGGAARFHAPGGLVADRAGNVYVADALNATVRAVAVTSGAVTTLAGQANTQGSSDGATGLFNTPTDLAWDGGDNLYVTDSNSQTIRRVSLSSRAISTVAGSPQQIGSSDGTGATARFSYPRGIVFAGDGNLYVADTANDTIRRIVPASGAVTTIAGAVGLPGFTDGTGAAARLNTPIGLATSGDTLWIADSANFAVRAMTLSSAAVTTLAGGRPGTSDGKGTAAQLLAPTHLAFAGGTLLVTDGGAATVRRIDVASSDVHTLLGVAGTFKVDLRATPPALNSPYGIAIASDGGIVISIPNENSLLLFR
jgi:sugar lactone lactonase YvrE